MDPSIYEKHEMNTKTQGAFCDVQNEVRQTLYMDIYFQHVVLFSKISSIDVNNLYVYSYEIKHPRPLTSVV